jgi:hypothetical protein
VRKAGTDEASPTKNKKFDSCFAEDAKLCSEKPYQMAKGSPKKSGSRPWRYERRHDELAPRSIFIKRIIGSLGIASVLIACALVIGIAGYHFIAGFNFIDSLLEASMILGGMGPVKEMPSDGAKIFASIYALFSGLILIALMGIILSPVAHRVMHQFHVDEKDVNKN